MFNYRSANLVCCFDCNSSFFIHVHVRVADHLCENAGCSHLCLLSSATGYTCTCPNGLVLDSDQKTCRRKFCVHNNNYVCIYMHLHLCTCTDCDNPILEDVVLVFLPSPPSLSLSHYYTHPHRFLHTRVF